MRKTVALFLTFSVALAFVISDVRVEGLKNLDEDFVLSLIGDIRGMEASVSLVNTLKDRLIESGYFEDVSVLLDTDESGNIVLVFRVEENPILKGWSVEIDGPKLVGDVASAVTLKEGTILNLREVKESAREILEMYKRGGYTLVEVKPELGEGTVVFHVIEYALWDVVFEGADGLDATSLKKELGLKTLKDYEEKPWWLKIFSSEKDCYPKTQDIQRAIGVLRNKIFFESVDVGLRKAPSKKPAVLLIFRLKLRKLFEGERDLSLRLEGVTLFDPEELKKKIWKDGRKRSIDVLMSAQKLLDEYEKRGYLMTWASVSIEGSEAVFHVYEKFVEDVRITYEKSGVKCEAEGECPFRRTRPILVGDLLTVRAGEPLRRDEIQSSYAALARSQYFEKVEILPFGDRESTNVRLEVVLHEKEKRFQIMGGAGWGPPGEGKPWWMGIMGQVQLSTVNPLGLGQRASLSLNVGVKSKTFRVDHSFPRPFDLPVNFGWGSGYTLESSGTESTSTLFLSVSLSTLSIRSNTLGLGADFKSVSGENRVEVYLTHTFDNRNSALLATEGLMSYERFQAPVDLSSWKVWQVGEVHLPLKFGLNFTLKDFAGRSTGEEIYPPPGWGVRGQRTGGRDVIRLSAELRYRLGVEIPADLVAFYDWGKGEKELWSAGIGMAAAVPVLGEIEVGYAYMSSKRSFDLYFTIGVMPWSTSSGAGM